MSETLEKKNMGTDFTQGAVMPQLLRFFLPFLLANLLNSLYNTVDTIIIGQFVGGSGIVAVNMGGKMLNLFTNMGIGFAGGGQVMISQFAGAHRREEYNSTIGTLFTEMLSLSVIFAVFTLIFAEPILVALNTPEDSLPQALAYLRITCIGLPLIFGYNAVSSVLRGMGDSKNPLIFIAIAAVFNLVGDIIFIVCFGLGAAGTAIATVMGQGISLIFSVTLLYRRRERFGFDFKLRSFAVDTAKLRTMLRLGFPVAVRTFFIVVTQLYLLGFVNLCGEAEAAAYAIGDKVYHLANVFAMSTKQAAGGMVAQNIGADRHDRVKSIVRCGALVAYSAAGVMVVCSLLFPRQIFGLFINEPAVLDYARVFMAICCVVYVLSATMCPFEAVITGTGAAGLSFLGGMLDGVVFRIGFSFLFAGILGMGAPGFFLGDALARLGPVIVGGTFYFSGAWKRRKKIIK